MQAKIDDIRVQQRGLRTPAAAHRRATHDLQKAEAALKKMQQDVAEKEEQLQKLQEALTAKKVNLEAKQVEVTTLGREVANAALTLGEDARAKVDGGDLPNPREVKAEEVGTAESTLGASSQAKKVVSKQKATEALEQQSSEEKTLEKINNTVAEVVEQSMTQDTDENFKTVVDETIVFEDKEDGDTCFHFNMTILDIDLE